MASAGYAAWIAAGKPLSPSQPIRDYVNRLKVQFPRAAAANLFGWHANDAHYQAVPPEDHTPFSATGWPQTSPRWVVFATDVMHRPDLGVDCNVLFPYWLAEAKAGRTPWVKYLIWQAKLYDVRNGWKPVANSGHFDHIHISVRTDHLNTSLGAWSLVPNGGNMAADYARTTGWLLQNGVIQLEDPATIPQTDQAGSPPIGPGAPNVLAQKLNAIEAAVGKLALGGVDPDDLAAALAANAEFLAALAKAVNDDAARRLQS